jgi:type I pantothenate kinase
MTRLLGDLAASIAAHEHRPTVVGVSGAVAVGKSTIAAELADRIAAAGTTVHVISTDAFLFPNSVLAERDLVMRKGFPETYDFGALAATIETVRRSEAATIPVYSHGVYDILPGESERVAPTDVLVVEGVVALQPPLRELLDIAISVEAPAEMVRGWFVERFLVFTDEARADPASFYHGFAQLDAAQVRSIAEGVWDGINGVNLHEHIAPSGATADVVVEKGSDHRVLSVHPPA